MGAQRERPFITIGGGVEESIERSGDSKGGVKKLAQRARRRLLPLDLKRDKGTK